MQATCHIGTIHRSASITWLWLLGLLCSLFVYTATASGATGEEQARTHDALLDEAAQWVARQLAVSPQQIEFGALDARVRVQDCARYRMDFPFASRNTIRVSCEATGWQLYLRVSVREVDYAAFATRNLRRGETLAAADLALEPVRNYQQGMLRDSALAAGRTLRRDIARGDPVLVNDLDETIRALRLARDVREGDAIALTDHNIEVVSALGAPDSVFSDIGRVDGRRARRDLRAGELLLNDDLMQERRVLVAARNLAIGTILEPGLVWAEVRDARGTPGDAIESAAGLETFETNRHVRSGEILRASDLRAAALVKRGELVTMSLERGNLQIVVKVEALSDGRLGEKVSLRNPDSQRTFSGIVTGRSAVRGL